MTASRVLAAVLLVVAVAAVVVRRTRAPRAFVTAGRGSVSDPRTISVTRVAVAPATLDYDGHEIQAGPDHAYVLLDCLITPPVDQVHFDDFQLVRDRAATLGAETNIGDNGDRDYFYWAFLDASGRPVSQPPAASGPFAARLAFKVPADAREGYLFYWGLYWGPLKFPMKPGLGN